MSGSPLSDEDSFVLALGALRAAGDAGSYVAACQSVEALLAGLDEAGLRQVAGDLAAIPSRILGAAPVETLDMLACQATWMWS